MNCSVCLFFTDNVFYHMNVNIRALKSMTYVSVRTIAMNGNPNGQLSSGKPILLVLFLKGFNLSLLDLGVTQKQASFEWLEHYFRLKYSQIRRYSQLVLYTKPVSVSQRMFYYTATVQHCTRENASIRCRSLLKLCCSLAKDLWYYYNAECYKTV